MMFNKIKKIIYLSFTILILSVGAKAQQVNVHGTVKDGKSGVPLPGVNILVKGTSRGVSTNSEGAYSINVPSRQDTLVFSYIGYNNQQILINGRSEVNVNLNLKTQSLEQVVVLGYSSKSQSQIQSSVSQVSEKKLKGVTTTSPTDLLEGKAAGVYISNPTGEPGSTPNIRVRGTGSISAGAGPLYVVDGVIAGDGSYTNMASVSPSDIKSVTVLKDASATALYGSRAANGVVVITTKKGERGSTKIDVSYTTGTNYKTNGNFHVMNSQQLYNYQKSINAPNLTPDLLNRDTDWQDIAFRRGVTNKYHASVSGGDENTTFYVSGNYYNEEGTLISTDFDRISGRLNFQQDVNDQFTISADLSGNYENHTNNPASTLYGSYVNLPWDEPYNSDGMLKTGQEADWRGRNKTNFLYPLQYNSSQSRSQYLLGNVKLQYDFKDWIYLTTTDQVTLDQGRSEYYYDKRTSAGSTNNGELNNSYSYNTSILSSNLVHVSKQFGDHHIGGLAGFEYQNNYSDGAGGLGIGISPGLDILDVTASANSISGYKSRNDFVSALVQANYNYKNTYFTTLSYRRDGSSKFGADNRYGNFYSVGTSWLISNEKFMQNNQTIDQLKLRASYGTTGNADIGNYLSQGLYSFSVQYDGNPGSVPTRTPNPDLTWEVAHTLNLGVDLGLFNRANLTIDIYQKTNKNLLQSVILPGTSGYDSRTLNVGSVRNEGLEIALSTQNIQSAFSWTTDFNIAFNRNKVQSLYNGEAILNGNQRIMQGHDIYTWYLRKWVGVDPQNGDPLWEQQIKDADGNVIKTQTTNNYNDATLQPVGVATPNFTGGISNTFQYKGFSLKGLFTFTYGNKVYHSARELFDSDGAYITFNNMVLENSWSRWQNPGDDATHPKAIVGGNKNSNKPSSRYLEDGSYLRLKNVTLSYNLPASFLSGAHIHSARIFVSGDNLVTFTNFSGTDPELAIGQSISGVDRYPISRKILLGVNLGL